MKWLILLALTQARGQSVPPKLFELTGVASSDGASFDSKVTHVVPVRTVVECSAYAYHFGSHGFRMRDSNKTCQLMNLQWTQLDPGGAEKVIHYLISLFRDYITGNDRSNGRKRLNPSCPLKQWLLVR